MSAYLVEGQHVFYSGGATVRQGDQQRLGYLLQNGVDMHFTQVVDLPARQGNVQK